jgi:FMN-dependent NADH-azoreductase
MATLLHVAASPRAQTSESLRLAEAFLKTYRARHPEVTLDTLNLWEEPLLA